MNQAQARSKVVIITGLEVANQVIEQLGMGAPARIIAVEPDEPHIELARGANRAIRDMLNQFLPTSWLP